MKPTLTIALAVLVGTGALAGPRLGVGTQFTFPAVAGISVRGCFTNTVGLEGVAFVFSDSGSTFGMVALRGLWWAVREKGAGFYLAGGATLPLPPGTPFLHAVAGIELALPFAPAVWLDTEFGFVSGGGLDLGMAFGLGIHYYFHLGGERQ